MFESNTPAFLLAITFYGTIAGCGQSDHRGEIASVLQRAETMHGGESAAADQIALVAGSDVVTPARSKRKIIYTAEIDLVVEDFGDFENQIRVAIASHDGFAADRKTDRQHGDHRGGRWVIRVPVENYDRFLSGLSTLGFARSRSETSDDVTEAYVDLQARIRNKQKLEQRIIELIEQRPGKLADLMELERELARIREEIERMQGRLSVLADQTSLATVNLTVSEQATYQPPAAPTLGDRVAAAWTGSLRSIRQLGAGLVIVIVALAPWTLIGLPLVAIAYRVRRRLLYRPRVT